MNLAEVERDKYSRVWQNKRYSAYSPGEKHFESARKALGVRPGESLIDYGCGTGRAAKRFQDLGLSVIGIDHVRDGLDAEITFQTACLWDLPDIESDWFYCTDVLEHIPPEMVEDVISGIADRTKEGGFFSISCRPDGFGPETIGEPLHLCVRPGVWWQELVAKYFLIEAETIATAEALFVCRSY